MLLALVCTLGAYVAFYRAPTIGFVLTLLAVGCFIAAYVIAFRGPKNLGSERRWRGQVIDTRQSAGSDLGPQIRRWWDRLRRR